MDIERDLLFGLFAVREGYISLDDYASACRDLSDSAEGAIAELLIRKGLIDERVREVLEEGVKQGLAPVRSTSIRPGRDNRATTMHETFGLPISLLPKTENAPPPTMPKLHDPNATLQIGSEPPQVEPLPRTVKNSGDVLETRSAETLMVGDSKEGQMPVASGQARPQSHQNPARYTFIKVIGEGGLGRVWKARDNDLNREVALKEIQPRLAQSDTKARRFLLEAQVTGQLEHPNIVPVYELAHRSEDGQPFYTMRFVRGKTLSDQIAEYHQKRKDHTANRLDFARLLGRFYGVCYALGYAHSRGVIHRDLKPENVVLGDYGEVYLIDWGLAKLVDIERDSEESSIHLSSEAALSDVGRGGLEGTPAYMAPEQVDATFGSIGTHSDIYGLGAILFEVLTGEAPHRGESIMILLDEIVKNDTPLVRQRQPSVPAALEAICAKAMAKDLHERYQKAGDLALEVQRYMNDEPVSAYREPPLERLTRWARRHKTWTQAAAAALMIVTLVSIMASVLIKGAQTAEAVARKEAEGRYEQARSFADTLLSGVSNDLKDVPGAEGIQKRILDKASAAYQGFASERSSDPALVLKSGQAHLQLAEVHNLLDETTAAVESCQAAETAFASLVKNYPNMLTPATWRARSLAMQGRVLNHSGKNEDALTPYREAMSQFDALIAKHAHDVELLESKAEGEIGYALVLQELEQLAEAEKTYRAALADYDHLIRDAEQEIAKKTPGVSVKPAYRQNRARGLNNLAILLRVQIRRLEEQNKRDDAAKLKLEYDATCRKAIADLETLVGTDPDVPEYLFQLAASLNGMGTALRMGDKPKEAEQEFTQAVGRYETLVYQKTVPRHMNGLVRARLNLAQMIVGSNLATAEDILRAAVYDARVLARVFPDDPTYVDSLSSGYYELGKLLRQQGRNADAVTALSETIRLSRDLKTRENKAEDAQNKNLTENDRRLREALFERCLAYLDLKRLEDALEDLKVFPEMFLDDFQDQYNAACCWSRATTLTTDVARKVEFGKRAVVYLQRAVKLDPAYLAAIADATSPNHDPDLDPIRGQEAFKAFIKPAQVPKP